MNAFAPSAKDLAPLLGITERAVRKGMAGKLAQPGPMENGRIVQRWSFTDLRDEWRARLFAIARERTNGDVRALFPATEEPAPVAPPVLEAEVPAAPAIPPADLNLYELPLAEEAAAVAGQAEPDSDALAWLLHKAFARHEELLALDAGPSVKRARQLKAALVEWLHRALKMRWPDRDTFRRHLNAECQQWIAGGRTFAALLDRRPMKSGNFRTPDFSADERKIAKLAVQMRGKESTARRILEQEGKLSPAYCAYYPLDERTNKSGLSKGTRRRITGAVEATLPLYRGPKTARDAGPYIVRDWSDEQPGDWDCLDDATFEFYHRFRRPDGRWDVTRGECLGGSCAVSDYPLPFLLLSRRYNGLDVRRVKLRIFDKKGNPRKGWLLENGIWRSRFVVGSNADGWRALHWREHERGISDPRIGLRIHHATIHRAKTQESVWRRLQVRMSRLPICVGPDERREPMERLQKLIARAHRGDEEALAFFPTLAEAVGIIENAMEEFAHEPGNGDRLRGRTPAEWWSEALDANPRKQMSAEVRALMSTHEKIVTLVPALHGFQTKIPGIKVPLCYNDKGGQLEKLIFKGERQVRVRIDLEHPELATCYDMKGTVRFPAVGLTAKAMSATKGERDTLSAIRRGSRQESDGLFGEILAGRTATITRDDEQTEATREEGRFHNAAVAQHTAGQTDKQREIADIHRRASRLGVELPSDLSAPRVRRGLLRQLKALETTSAEPLTLE